MKVTLIISVSANGKVLVADNPNHRLPDEVIGFLIQKAHNAGNIVVGKTTYELIIEGFGLKNALKGVEIIILSNTKKEENSYKVVSSPEEAITYAKQKGYNELIVAGGVKTYNTFLDKDLATDVYLTYAPIIVGDGGELVTKSNLYIPFNNLSGDIVAENVIRFHISK